MFNLTNFFKQFINKPNKPEIKNEKVENKIETPDVTGYNARVINIETAYLRYEKIIFPMPMTSDQVYTKEYLSKLDQSIEDVYNLLPTATLKNQNISVNECLKGIILGDMYGSPFEVFREKAEVYNVKDILIQKPGKWTDDTIMTIATMRAVKDIQDNNKTGSDMIFSFSGYYRALAKEYPHAGYGGNFYDWAVFGEDDPSYISCGDGSAMRAGIIGVLSSTLKECITLAAYSALPTHAHSEGIKGAVCTAVMTYYATRSADKRILSDIANIFYPHGARNAVQYARADYGYLAPDLTLREIRQLHPLTLKVTCQIAVPLAISLFLLSDTYIDFIKHLSILPMDADTVGAIAGGIMTGWSKFYSDGVSVPMPDISCFKESADSQPEEIMKLLGF